MASATRYAPSNLEELKHSLLHDTKVKVAGIDGSSSLSQSDSCLGVVYKISSRRCAAW
ncbi:hypothetical protein M378DRAFT_166641 [Amanita muscaria Koide BX008]|uniref:Uncharacterized protein n=1 Tax=Amanita muscaria (strain Koide BX008) TaxID=946122 RepID=A0A0C2SF37_AMAMK|nr:hypothetical protein M378DRAFT_166641 [Amanita muscaria Koide BX008]